MASQWPLPLSAARALRAVLVVDIVESVRLIERDEEGVVARWLGFVDHIERDVLPAGGGRLVKQLGDGLLAEFRDALAAVRAAFAIQEASRRANAGLGEEQQMLLRIGIELSDVIIARHDVYGHGVNVATRLAALAGPGETVVSGYVRDQLTATLDAEIEDLGECFLKHVQRVVRAYRVGPPGPRPLTGFGFSLPDLLPTLAVIPFTPRNVSSEHHVLGEVLAEEIIRDLTRSPDLNVISRLSTTVFRGREVSLAEINAGLNADYVLSGVFRVEGGQIVLDTELAEARSAWIVWSQRLRGRLEDVVADDQEMVHRVVGDVRAAVMCRELARVRSQTLPTLKSYSLLMGASALMHRASRQDFEDARTLLQTLIDRATRQSIAHAYLAHWYVLRVQQGWSDDQQRDSYAALESTKRALDTDPECSLAIAIDGAVHTNLLKRLDVAQERYGLAVQANPNDSLAWLLKGTLHAFMGQGKQAVADTQHALKLSPLDPHRYYYDSLAATACNAAQQYQRALELSQRSLRANCKHTSTLRTMAIAQWHLGLREDARKTAQELLRLEPNLTVDEWLRRSPSAAYSTGKEWAKVLREVGVPT
jgi:adenylate cyclase